MYIIERARCGASRTVGPAGLSWLVPTSVAHITGAVQLAAAGPRDACTLALCATSAAPGLNSDALTVRVSAAPRSCTHSTTCAVVSMSKTLKYVRPRRSGAPVAASRKVKRSCTTLPSMPLPGRGASRLMAPMPRRSPLRLLLHAAYHVVLVTARSTTRPSRVVATLPRSSLPLPRLFSRTVAFSRLRSVRSSWGGTHAGGSAGGGAAGGGGGAVGGGW